MHRYPIKTAAQLAEASYAARRHPTVGPRIVSSLDRNDVQAHFLDNRILLIPGSNSVLDYIKFNLRVLRIGRKRYSLSDDASARGSSGTIWHQGFLAHAKEITDWLAEENRTPIYIIGHSLGAAAAQILTKTYGVPGIAFAAPRPRKARGPLVNGKLCLCINRDDDFVCGLPGRFRHIGTVHDCAAEGSAYGAGHKMAHYRNVVAEQQAAGKLRRTWPA